MIDGHYEFKDLILFYVCVSALAEVIDKLPGLQVYVIRTTEKVDKLPNSVNLDKALVRTDARRCVKDIEQAKMTDKILYIYTSGTTGLPKAAVMTHARYMLVSHDTYLFLKFKSYNYQNKL